MNCSCAKREPCPIHKDKPLPMPDAVCRHTYVINLYHTWSTNTWHATISKDALRIGKTVEQLGKLNALLDARKLIK